MNILVHTTCHIWCGKPSILSRPVFLWIQCEVWRGVARISSTSAHSKIVLGHPWPDLENIEASRYPLCIDGSYDGSYKRYPLFLVGLMCTPLQSFKFYDISSIICSRYGLETGKD